MGPKTAGDDGWLRILLNGPRLAKLAIAIDQ